MSSSGRVLALGFFLATILKLRKDFTDPRVYPGRKEKEFIVGELLSRKNSTGYSFISPEKCDILLDRLNSVPDKDDIEGYIVKLHKSLPK